MFRGEAADPDSDRLKYTWYLDGVQFGVGPSFSTKISTEGTHKITLEVWDKKNDPVKTDIQITVTKADTPQPHRIETEKEVSVAGMSLPTLIIVIGFVILIAAVVGSTLYARGSGISKQLKELERQHKKD